MSKNSFWYGYLEAGDKSSAVLRDPDLDTGNRKTVFLFNLARNRILEYNVEVVEPKLRPLADTERDLIGKLESAFQAARRDFTPVRRSLGSIPDSGPPPRQITAQNDEEFDDEETESDIETVPLADEDQEEEV
jgi:hypothetical protein